MKIKGLLLTLLCLIFHGCFYYRGYHFDYLTCFSIKGTVFDKLTDAPLNEVKLYFIDTGYDSSRHHYQMKIGASDSFGNISLKFCYRWGYDTDMFRKSKPERTFDIILSKKNYKKMRLMLKQADLNINRGTVQVDLNNIHLASDLGKPGENQENLNNIKQIEKIIENGVYCLSCTVTIKKFVLRYNWLKMNTLTLTTQGMILKTGYPLCSP